MKKINLGGIQSAPASAKPTHETVEVTDEETNTLLKQFVLINPQFKTLKAQSETLGKQLQGRIKALFFEHFQGRSPETSTILVNAGGRTVKLITKNAYSNGLTDDEALIAAIGKEKVSEYFKQATVLKLDLDQCPEDRQEDFANRVLALAKELGAEAAVSASQCIQPKAGFHEARTHLLTLEENKALDKLMPVTAYAML